MNRGFQVAFLFAIVTQVNAQQGLTIAPRPGWVTSVPYQLQVSDTTNTSGGYYWLLFNQQYNPETQERFTEYIIKVLSEKGLSYASSINENFDPSFQKLEFHDLKIIRNGTAIDKLDRSAFSLLRREEDLSRQMYDGTLSAVLDLKGVQAGDIVKYSFTTRGFNKAFKGHFFRTLSLDFGAPTGKIYHRICASPGRVLYFKNFENDVKPSEGYFKQYKTYTWDVDNVGGFLNDDSAPGWFDPYPRVEVTDFASWEQLSTWATDLYKIDARQSTGLKSFIDSLRELGNKDQQILGAVRTIQDKVRYLSLSNGISGFQPHPPSEVFENKYGDCKDKSVLLAQVLNSIGVSSRPVLVNTTEGKLLHERLPSPWLFDHCIVQFEYEDSTYWIDPTISFQGGTLKKTHFPMYRQGLVIGENKSALTTIPLPKVHRFTSIKEDYFVDELGSDARLIVTTEYHGSDADASRDYWLATSQAEIDKNFMNFYANEYPGISTLSPTSHEDDKVNNVVTTHEEYKINNFWLYDSTVEKYTASTYARYLATYLNKPSTKVRTAPYALGLGTEVSQTIKVHMPEEWNMKDEQKTSNFPGMNFEKRYLYADRVIRLDYSLAVIDDHVPKEKIAEYIKGIDGIYDEISFEISYTPNDTSGRNFNTPFLVICLVFAVGLYFVMIRLYNYDPAPNEFIQQYRTIGGWLVLPALGISITPFLILYQLYNLDFFNYNQWRQLTDPDFAAYNPMLGAFVVYELLVNVALIGYSTVLLLLFWRRRTSTPLFASILYGASFVILLVDSLLGNAFGLATEPEEITAITRSLIFAAIWIPYFRMSERVKGTFTQRLA